MAPTLKRLGLPSKRLILSYVFDWIVIIGIAAVGYGFNNIDPYNRPFSLDDLTISFPKADPETVPMWLVIVIDLVAPGLIIFFVCLIFVPGNLARKSTSREVYWRRKLWELNTGWMGLGLSLALAFMITEGMKNLFGRPRPDLLDRCIPDFNRIGEFTVGNFAQGLGNRWRLVSSGICQSTDHDELQDGFRSFPSGHASFSWAGLLYLALFLTSKFSIAIPFLPPRQYELDDIASRIEPSQFSVLPLHRNDVLAESALSSPTGPIKAHGNSNELRSVPIRNQAAAPPTFLLVLPLIPIGAAVWVTATRFTDFRHHSTDLLAGSLLGIVTAWFGFRWFHLPTSRGAGWAWGARSYKRAFGVGVGVNGFVGPEGWGKESESSHNHDSVMQSAAV